MPKRTAKQIRLDTFAALEENGRLDVPLYNKKVAPSKTIKRIKKPLEQPYCCEVKYGDNLPERFRRCFDCPKNTEV